MLFRSELNRSKRSEAELLRDREHARNSKAQIRSYSDKRVQRVKGDRKTALQPAIDGRKLKRLCDTRARLSFAFNNRISQFESQLLKSVSVASVTLLKAQFVKEIDVLWRELKEVSASIALVEQILAPDVLDSFPVSKQLQFSNTTVQFVCSFLH